MLLFPRTVVFEELLDAGIEIMRGGDRVHDLLIPLHEFREVHLRNKIDRAIGIIAGVPGNQAAFFFQPLVEFCPLDSVTQSNHRRYHKI